MFARKYFIKNDINNLLYIGSTSRDVNERFKEHHRDMSRYPNLKLYKAMNEHCVDVFTFY